ncbi:molecular chaperone DnaK [Actibacterium mucosum KCTC 23349]|uniref:Molecular chaperone DnaK n=1 Tax=Actibacterium mucosum KCTC 23349 TaxID=1454373 RepID=A0A037ZJ28_9RHOB|nr:Hsp70 family protein [Actibacterium mucosum]KAJ54825.1 molecular chaperone DnaK [Actibacterium mucosum KCTC 23349]
MPADTLAIDFGTSNSAAAILRDGKVERIAIELGAETLPTAVFFPTRGGGMQVGTVANDALIDGAEGRYMRALKSVLGQGLLHEERLVGGRRQSLADIITAFLTLLRERAEAATGLTLRRALSGRPVHFHSNDATRDARALEDLRACYLAAGFCHVDFLPEPEAAAIACQNMGHPGALGLVVDIGGGTSDFTLFRTADGTPEILASHGIRLGGTDFDHRLSMAFAMPQLGLGGELRREMGPGRVPIPRAPYVELSTWAKIPFLYTAKTRRLAEDMHRMALEPQKLARFAEVIEMELGHELAFAVERGKIAANGGADGHIRMEFIEPDLKVPLSPDAMQKTLQGNRHALGDAAAETLRKGGVDADQVGRVILVGGSSLMGFVSDEMSALCPNAELLRSEAFTAVVDGLALATAR